MKLWEINKNIFIEPMAIEGDNKNEADEEAELVLYKEGEGLSGKKGEKTQNRMDKSPNWLELLLAFANKHRDPSPPSSSFTCPMAFFHLFPSNGTWLVKKVEKT